MQQRWDRAEGPGASLRMSGPGAGPGLGAVLGHRVTGSDRPLIPGALEVKRA
ncbi:hypothetical protein [Streptomyces californicus]|uniref:hypothetical protein n=1 Tax=Streptomyces californicus TaxID=67351 RepID=UPI0037A05427